MHDWRFVGRHGEDAHVVGDKAWRSEVLIDKESPIEEEVGDDAGGWGASVRHVAKELLEGAMEVLGGMLEEDVKVGGRATCQCSHSPWEAVDGEGNCATNDRRLNGSTMDDSKGGVEEVRKRGKSGNG